AAGHCGVDFLDSEDRRVQVAEFASQDRTQQDGVLVERVARHPRALFGEQRDALALGLEAATRNRGLAGRFSGEPFRTIEMRAAFRQALVEYRARRAEEPGCEGSQSDNGQPHGSIPIRWARFRTCSIPAVAA